MYQKGFMIMKNNEIEKYLAKKAPMIEWKVEGDRIRGTTLVNGVKISDSISLTRANWFLDEVATAFMKDYEEKKKNATKKDIR